LASKFFFFFFFDLCVTLVFFFLSRSIFFFPKDLSLSLSLSLFGPEDDKKTISFSKSLFLVWATLGRHRNHPSSSQKITPRVYYNHHVCCFDFIHVRRRESFRRENDHRLQESGVLRSSELVWTEEGTNSESRFFSLFFSLFCTPVVCTRGADVFESK